jgi:Ras-related protein Rab-1A
MQDDYDYIFKILIIGESSVGKSSTVSKFADDYYNENLESSPTIGVDLHVKIIEVDDKKIKMQIWEIGGNERFRKIVSSYYRNCQGIVLMFDLTNKESFENLQMWINHIKENCNNEDEYCDDIPKILVGNKNDLKIKRSVSYEEAYDFSCDLNIPYIETSVYNNDNINKVFELIAREIKMNRKYSLKYMKSFEDKVSRVKEERSCCFCNWFCF